MTVFVELLCDVAEGGRDLAKARAAADAFGLGKTDPKYPRLKVTVSKRGRDKTDPNSLVGHIAFKKGLVITMTEPDAAKWVDRGIGKVVAKSAETEIQTITAADVGTLKI